MSKRQVIVVMGGPSAEYEVSLNTGKSMLENLDPDKYDIAKAVIQKDGHWVFNDEKTLLNVGQALNRLKSEADVVVLAVHGTFGEDGTLQALLEQRGIVFTGSGTAASILAMDKIISNEIYESDGLLVPKTLVFFPADVQKAVSNIEPMLPVVVKPVRQGSSVGVSIVKKADEILPALKLALEHDQRVMVQEYIKGREVSCGVLEQPSGKIIALPPTELIPKKAEFFDYDSKYLEGGADEITPPDMPQKIIADIKNVAVKAHKLLGCRGYSRTDMIVRAGDMFVIETNTLPGMTKTSILPRQAAAAGISFSAVMDMLITSATTTI